MEKALFNNISNELVAQIHSAKHSIKIAMAWFTSDELFSALIDALNRDVRVELILLDNATNFHPYALDFNAFIQKGGTLRVAGSDIGFLHHKFCVIDDNCIITGSYNWTFYAEHHNIENIVISKELSIINAFNHEFERLVTCLPVAESSPHYSWEEIGSMDNIDFDELNYEIRSIVHSKNLTPVQPIIDTKPQERVGNIEQNAYAKFDIGTEYRDESNRPQLYIIIPQGTKLPYSTQVELYNPTEDLELCISRTNASNTFTRINHSCAKEILGNNPKPNMKMFVDFELTKDGYLKIVILCEETKKSKTIQLITQDLIDRR